MGIGSDLNEDFEEDRYDTAKEIIDMETATKNFTSPNQN